VTLFLDTFFTGDDEMHPFVAGAGSVPATRSGCREPGSSSAPHLHFQLSNGPYLQNGGMPFVYCSFDTPGECTSGGMRAFPASVRILRPEIVP
jgi:hypothetical protein